MSNPDQPKDQPTKRKVVEPLTSQKNDANNNPAIELLRSKIDHLYTDSEPKNKPVAVPKPIIKPTTKHQKYMYELRNSGKSLAEIQTAWHNYYVALPDDQKHQVWQEFYQEHANSHVNTAVLTDNFQHNGLPADQTKRGDSNNSKNPQDIKQQLVKKVRSRAKPKNPHIQSLLFGLAMGSFVVVIMLFSFFNERIIAPFITPSRTVSSTPIISDPNSTIVGPESKIIIPKINVEIPVVYNEPSIEEHAVQKALENGVLHYATTPNPGEQGNAVIFGHSSNNILNSGKYKFAFVLLSRLENGDTFMLQKGGKRYVYKVYEKKIVSPNEVSVLENTGKTATATLITCDPPGTSINRLVVIGEQISPNPNKNVASTAQPAESSTPEILPSNSPSLWQRVTNIF